MPYIRIRERDITPVASFDTIENAVLIFGFDFHRFSNADLTTNEVHPSYGNNIYKLYTSLLEFVGDINLNGLEEASKQLSLYRPYATAYDCLMNGLPVVYVPLDDYIDKDYVIDLPELKDSEGHIRAAKKYIEYNWLSMENPQDLAATDFGYWSANNITTEERDAILAKYNKVALKTAAERALHNLLVERVKTEDSEGNHILNDLLPLSDRVNMPITFITTCGFENYKVSDLKFYPTIKSLLEIPGQTEDSGIALTRLDVLYLYDLPADMSPDKIASANAKEEAAGGLPRINDSIVNIVHPWGTFNTYVGTNGLHMPGSYAYLMAYANSIKSNMPWLATAGVNRGVIPNIVNIDYDVREAYVHAWQGEVALDGTTTSDNYLRLRINPIINLGANYGKVIFGNRTCFNAGSRTVFSFKNFLNVRLLLIKIHKQAFKVSMRHTFEPNDDIVWLSFKQKVNTLLDQMVSGRGIKYYKWYKVRTDVLGQIRAQLTIRPIEAVESFDITINMTDQDITVLEGEE